MMDQADKRIGDTNWDACKKCVHFKEDGCEIEFVDLSVYLDDWIICENCEER